MQINRLSFSALQLISENVPRASAAIASHANNPKKGDETDPELIYRRAISISESVYGKNHQETAMLYHVLGVHLPNSAFLKYNAINLKKLKHY